MNVITPEVAFREYQAKCLASYISADPSITPSNLILQGYSGTGKTYTLKEYFKANPDLHAVCWNLSNWFRGNPYCKQ